MNHSWAAAISSLSCGLFLFSRCLTLLSFTSDPLRLPLYLPLAFSFSLSDYSSSPPSGFLGDHHPPSLFIALTDTVCFYADVRMGVDAAVLW